MSTDSLLLSFRGCLLNPNLFRYVTDYGDKQLLQWEQFLGDSCQLFIFQVFYLLRRSISKIYSVTLTVKQSMMPVPLLSRSDTSHTSFLTFS